MYYIISLKLKMWRREIDHLCYYLIYLLLLLLFAPSKLKSMFTSKKKKKLKSMYVRVTLEECSDEWVLVPYGIHFICYYFFVGRKTTRQRFCRWKMILLSYDYTIKNIYNGSTTSLNMWSHISFGILTFVSEYLLIFRWSCLKFK